LQIKGKGKVKHAPHESVGGAHLPLPGLDPMCGKPLMSVTHVQCDVRLNG